MVTKKTAQKRTSWLVLLLKIKVTVNGICSMGRGKHNEDNMKLFEKQSFHRQDT